jgi:hypothetical protein
MLNLDNIRPGAPIFVHGEYSQLAPSEIQAMSLAKLEAFIERGRERAAGVVSAILNEVPRDKYVPAGAMRFAPQETDVRMVLSGQPLTVHDHALDQTAERVGLTRRYLHDLMGKGEAWANQLLATNLNELLAHQAPKTRYLVREVNGRVRGVLSDAFKRIDSRPTVDALIAAAQASSAAIVDGLYTETRVSLKIVKDRPVEVFPGEWMIFGLDYANSDFGDGASEFSAFLLRLACLNGAVTSKELRRVHIGRRFSGDDGASEKTLRLDAATQASLARDQVRALLSNEATDHLVREIRRANGQPIAPDTIEGFLRTRTNKGEAQAIIEKFASADIVELPAGQTAWRFSNAISWLAKQTEDNRRRMELERVAGEALR